MRRCSFRLPPREPAWRSCAGFAGAAEASYFDKSLTAASVDATLAAVRSSPAYAQYLRVAALAPSAEASRRTARRIAGDSG